MQRIVGLIMSPLSQRGGDMLLYLCPLSLLAQLVSVRSLLSCRRTNTRRWPNAGLMLAHRLRRWPSIKSGLVQRFRVFWVSVCQSVLWWVCFRFIYLQRFLWYRRSNTRQWPNAGLMLAHRLWPWANICPVLGYRVMFGETLNVGQHHRRRANINPALIQRIVTVLYRQHAGTAEWTTDLDRMDTDQHRRRWPNI